MIRETEEEISVIPIDYEKMGLIEFDEYYKGKKENVVFHLYMINEWKGIPKESDEVAPEWFNMDEIPYNKMLPDDIYWLPQVLKGKKVNGYFDFDENWNLISKKVSFE